MGEGLSHNCGLCVTHSLHDAYSFIKSLQHRGREAAGIAAISNDRIDVLRWSGSTDNFDMGDLPNIFNKSYHTFMAHDRYATRGRKDKILEDSQPITLGGKEFRVGNHLHILDCDAVCCHNGQVSLDYMKGINFDELKTGSDSEALLHFLERFGAEGVLHNIPGAYTLAVAEKGRRAVLVMKDRTGIRPGVLGQKDGRYVVASEEIAFVENGAQFIEDLVPGSIYYLYPDGSYKRKSVISPVPRPCFFEGNYLLDVNSSLNGERVRNIRERLGKKLSDEAEFEGVDLVTFIPRCPVVAARAYADVVGLPFKPVFYKMRKERSFLGSTEEMRRESINDNLGLVPEVLEGSIMGKKIILMDDSIVRGNNSKRAIDLLYNRAKVSEIILLSYTPMIGIMGRDGVDRGCSFGVDMSPDDNFVARGKEEEQIGKELGVTLKYLSLKGLYEVYESLGFKKQELCTYCIGGEHPFNGLTDRV